MSEKSEGTQRKCDLSAFEAEFDGVDLFAALKAELIDATVVAEQVHKNVIDVQRTLYEYKRAMTEVDLPHKSPTDKLRHLNEAYHAAIDLEVQGELPAQNTLEDLQNRITAMKAIISQRSPE